MRGRQYSRGPIMQGSTLFFDDPRHCDMQASSSSGRAAATLSALEPCGSCSPPRARSTTISDYDP